MSSAQAWREGALCRPGGGYDPDLFFPMPKDRATRLAAAKVCHTCPVEDDCLDEANRLGERYGIWGGLNRNVHTGEYSRIGPGPAKSRAIADRRCGTERGHAAHLRRNENPCDACRRAHAAGARI